MAYYCVIVDAVRNGNNLKVSVDLIDDANPSVVIESHSQYFQFLTEGTNTSKRQDMRDKLTTYAKSIIDVRQSTDDNISVVISQLIGLRYPPL